MDGVEEIIGGLDNKVSLLVNRVQDLKQENKDLVEKLKLQEDKVSQLKNMANNSDQQNGSTKEIKEEINKILREVELCLTLVKTS